MCRLTSAGSYTSLWKHVCLMDIRLLRPTPEQTGHLIMVATRCVGGERGRETDFAQGKEQRRENSTDFSNARFE